jgi:phosphoglycolate phosphatase-like HAD superfamily hydrolase
VQLALFDIDGTLIDSVGLCDEPFAAAVAAVSGVSGVTLDWGLAPDATDSGGSAAHFVHYTGREPTPPQRRAMRDRFLAELRRADVRATLIAGAGDVLERVAALDGWRVGLATGNWRDAAAVKFGWAGRTLPDVPIGAADDAPRRVDILRAAVEKAARAAGIERFSRVVYFGDGVHDVRAARALGIAFVAVTAVRPAAPLQAAGARFFLRDFLDDERLRDALASAPVPSPSGNR